MQVKILVTNTWSNFISSIFARLLC